MNSHFAEPAAGEAPREAAPPARIGTGEVLLALVRRELWEHRALWIAPLVVAALMVLGVVVASMKFHLRHADMSADEPASMTMFGVVQSALTTPLSVVTLIVVGFYLLDCLYAERKDRSILFWKSLPVSDDLTVLSKLLVALVAVPLGVFALGLLVALAFTGIWELNAAFGRVPPIPGWDTLAWLEGEIALLLCLIVAVLWYAPFAAYLIVVSAWARRTPFLWSVVPVVVAPLLERIAFGTHFLWNFLLYRTTGIWRTLFSYTHAGRGRAAALSSGFGHLHFRAAFTDIDLWLGLAVAAALVLAAIRLRRYRDDT